VNLLPVLVLPEVEVIGEGCEIRIVVDNLGLAVGVVDVTQGLLRDRLRGLRSRGLLFLNLSLCLLWPIE
jgi:hypothetical protein